MIVCLGGPAVSDFFNVSFLCGCGLGGSLLEPIRKLLKSDVHFVWDATYDVALKRIKSAIANPNNLAYFDVKKETEIQCDASLNILQEGKPV